MPKQSRSWIPSSLPSDNMSIPFDKPKGEWNVKSPNLPPNNSSGELTNRANAVLIGANNKRIGLFVNQIETEFSLAGEVAQSQSQQQFFPHNFTQPRLRISGQAPNSYEFGRLGEMVRESHRAAIDDGDRGLSEAYRKVEFKYVGGDKNAKSYNRRGPIAGNASRERTGSLNRTTKGQPSRIHLQGFVSNMQRGAERFNVAYDWSFEFVVLRAVSFIGIHDATLTTALNKINATIEESLAGIANASSTIDPFDAYGDVATNSTWGDPLDFG